MRALFVEDNADVRELIVMLLEDEGLEVVACEHAEAALEAFAAEPFDLLLTDISLPGMSGVDLARKLMAERPSLWVVFTSGLPLGPALRELGPRVRALLKPFEPEDLHAAIEDLRKG